MPWPRSHSPDVVRLGTSLRLVALGDVNQDNRDDLGAVTFDATSRVGEPPDSGLSQPAPHVVAAVFFGATAWSTSGLAAPAYLPDLIIEPTRSAYFPVDLLPAERTLLGRVGGEGLVVADVFGGQSHRFALPLPLSGTVAAPVTYSPAEPFEFELAKPVIAAASRLPGVALHEARPNYPTPSAWWPGPRESMHRVPCTDWTASSTWAT